MLERKKCDDNFDREEKNVRKAVDKLLDAARACVRQAASDLARACRLVKDRDAQQLAVFLDNTQIDGGFENVRDACRLFNSSRRSTASGRNPTPLDLLVFSSLSLEDAASGLLSNDVNDLLRRNPTPLDLLVFSSLSLEDAASGLLSNDVNDLLQVGSNSVRSRASSAEVLGVLKHRRT